MNRTLSVFTLLSSALVLAAPAFADTITFTGPSLPVIGDPASYTIFSASLTQPSLGHPDWELQIETDYPAVIPTPGTSIPFVPYNGTGSFSIGDFIIDWLGNSYAVVLSAHDGLHAGDLYQADPFSQTKFQTSGQLVGIRNEPVWLVAAGAIDLGAGSISVVSTGKDGITGGKYLITDDFAAPSNFLSSGNFDINVSSFVCANGIIIGTGGFGTTGPQGGVPEPGTMFLALPALLAIVCARRKAART